MPDATHRKPKLRKPRSLDELEIANLGASFATLTMVSRLYAHLAATRNDPAAFLTTERKQLTDNLKNTLSDKLTDEETLIAIENGQDALDFVFDPIKVRPR